MSSYITTYTRKHFDPVHPDPERIVIEDIAHALSLLCRGNGHVTTFWSVGQHCICCAKEAAGRGLSDRIVLACLLHDASECYMSDVPRPFKQTMQEYICQEETLLSMVYTRYLGTDLTAEEQKQIKEQYIKEAEKISDFLRIMKAYNAVLYFEDIKAYREHKNLVNRLNNCEQANVEKTINSALNQVSDIELIENKIGIDALDEKLQTVCVYRKKYKEASLSELSNIISMETNTKVTKSGLNHRMRKIKEIANNLRRK